eukprot:1515488-Pyramimonas_sp.AAC.1
MPARRLSRARQSWFRDTRRQFYAACSLIVCLSSTIERWYLAESNSGRSRTLSRHGRGAMNYPDSQCISAIATSGTSSISHWSSHNDATRDPRKMGRPLKQNPVGGTCLILAC